MEDHHGNKLIYPFIHQVGGHSSMLCLDEYRVCKPVIERELAFYTSLPIELQPFTPSFFGIIQVNVIFDGEFMCLVTSHLDELSKANSRSGRLKLRRSGSVELFATQCMFEEEVANGMTGTTGVNPWVVKCHRDHLASLAQAIETSKQPKNFLVLENLTAPFKLPCILDLKMGTLQYDENDSLAKKQSKMYKVISTTTGKLGLRIAGMQVYQITTGKFLCRNKLYGRALTPSGFSLALRQFLDDGLRLRTELLSPFIRRLEELFEILTDLGSLRLITASLLLLYEGEAGDDIQLQNRKKEEQYSITRSRGLSREESLSYELEGEIFERSSSVESIGSIVEGVSEARRISRSSLHDRRRSSSCTSQPRSSSELSSDKKEEPFIDVRIIDFAHSSHSYMEEKTVYTGPDESFLFGLGNIIGILKGIDRDLSVDAFRQPIIDIFSTTGAQQGGLYRIMDEVI